MRLILKTGKKPVKILEWAIIGYGIFGGLYLLLVSFALIFTPDPDKEIKRIDYDCKLRDPTYQEMKNFLIYDLTDLNEFSEGVFFSLFSYYDCSNFAKDVKVNAIKKGIRCACVSVRFKERGSGHVVIAFNTIDKGVIFIEPQTDEEIKIAVGVEHFGKTISSYYIYWPKLNEFN